MSKDFDESMKAGFKLNPGQRLKDVHPNVGAAAVEDRSRDISPGETMVKSFTLDSSGHKLVEVDQSDEALAGSSTVPMEEQEDEPVAPVKFWSSPVLWILILLLCYGGLQTYSIISSAFATGSVTGIFWSVVVRF